MNTIKSLFAHKTWANNELFNLLATVDIEAHAQPVHAAIRTLNHIYVVDRIFQAHLQGKQHKHSATNTDITPELSYLQFNVAECDIWYENYVSEVLVDQLKETIAFRFTDGDSGTMTREEMLLHVITHGSYHRGNIGQILKSVSISPPRDLYTKFLHASEPARRLA